jgi:hypothetical protein
VRGAARKGGPYRDKARLDTAVEDGERELPSGGNRQGSEYRRGACWRTGP